MSEDENTRRRDITEPRAEELLRAIVDGTASVTGTAFFTSLVQHLARALQVRRVYVAECRELADFLGDYLDGELDPNVRTSFVRHLDVCINCRRYLAQYRRAIALGRGAFEEVNATPPEDVPEDLIR